MGKLTHIDPEGRVRMVDIGGKSVSRREARASCVIRLSNETLGLVRDNNIGKGEVLNTARIAGIQAAKRTCELIPLAHPIPIEQVEIQMTFTKTGIMVGCRVMTDAKTGVEMEALTGAAAAALTIYDMVKGVEKGATITRLRLDYKSGGRRGEFRRR